MALAVRGRRDFDNGEEQITEESQVSALRRKALGITTKSFALALAFTVIVYLTV